MAFIEDYAHIISPFLKKYSLAKNEKVRKAVIKNAVSAVTSSSNLLENEGKSIPNDVEMVRFLIIHHFIIISIIIY